MSLLRKLSSDRVTSESTKKKQTRTKKKSKKKSKKKKDKEKKETKKRRGRPRNSSACNGIGHWSDDPDQLEVGWPLRNYGVGAVCSPVPTASVAPR